MTPEFDMDKLVDNPQRFSNEKVINIIPDLTESQRMKLKLRVKELLREETSLPRNEQNHIFVKNYNEILDAIEGHGKQSVTYNLIDFIGLKDRVTSHLLKTVKREEANIRKILNVCLSAYTDDPVNLAYVSPSSTGKTYLVESVTECFPAEDLIALKSISRKAFTRERGRLVLKTYTEDGVEYTDTIKNPFTDEQNTISEYIAYLTCEIESKENKEKPARLESLREARAEIRENLMTLIDFTDKILVLLDRPSQGFWADMLSVASHDSEYLESSFVEGEGTKYTKHIVYKHWPAIIFCTSKDEDFAWKDLETRFELAAPFESPEKFSEAIDLSLEKKFGIPQISDPEVKTLRNQIRQLVAFMKEHRPKAYLPLPHEIRRAFLGDKIERPDLMRKFPRIMSHIALNTLFNVPDRVIFKNEGEYVLVSPDDFRELLKEFSNNELNAALHGFTESVFIFLNEVLIPLCRDSDTLDRSYRNPTQAEVCTALGERDLPIGKTKQMCSRYLRALEERNVIKREKSENDKRGMVIIPLIDTLESLSKRIDENVEELVNTYRKAIPGDIGVLLKQNFTVFHRGVEISKLPVPEMPEPTKKIVNHFPDHDIWKNSSELQRASNTGFLITSILERSGYFTTQFTNFSDDPISYSGDRFTNSNIIASSVIKTKNTASENISKNAIAQKTIIPYGFINFSLDNKILSQDDSRPLSPDLQPEPEKLDFQSKKPYKSVDVVLRALKDWGLDVLEYDHVLFEQGKWKVKIKGRFDSLTTEQQEFLEAGFEPKFRGSPTADFTWVHFEVVAQ